MKDQSGNVLWFILLAVALITALTITVSSSSDQTEQSGNIERYRIQASEMLNYAKTIEQAVSRLSIRGIAENDISFETTELGATYTHGNCTEDTCRVFRKNGGGAIYEAPDPSWLDKSQSAASQYGDWFFASSTCVSNVARGGTDCHSDGNNNEDLIMIMPYVKSGICVETNILLGITNIDLSSPAQVDDATLDLTAPYQGGFNEDGYIILDNDSYLDGKKTGCYYDDTLGANFFYHVLIPR